MSIQNTAASANSTGKVLSISDATTGSGYGVYSTMTGHGNTGYAGYFINTDTSSNVNYGVYGLASSTSVGYGVFGTITGTGNTGCGGCFTNASGGGLGISALETTTTGSYSSFLGAAI